MVYRRTPDIAARQAAVRERILTAATALVTRGGYTAATIEAVATTAGVATGTVYRHFGCKADLLAEVFRRAARHELAAAKAAADLAGAPVEAAFRPWEALEPFVDDATIRQLNSFAGASPIASGDGSHRSMNFAIDTGDSADSQQLNETEWCGR